MHSLSSVWDCGEVFFIVFPQQCVPVRKKDPWVNMSLAKLDAKANARFIVIRLDGDGHIATPWQHPSPWWNAHLSPSESWTDTDVHLSIFVTFSDTNG